MTLAIFRIRLDALRLSGARIVAHHTTVLRFSIRDVVIERIRHVVKAVATGHAIPIGVRRTEGVARAAGAAPRLVILQAAVHVVEWLRVVHRDRVELRADDVLHVVPRAAAIVGDVHAAVVTEHDVLAIFRVDPKRVCVAVHATAGGESDPGLAAVVRFLRIRIQAIHMLGVGRIAAHLAVIPRRAIAGVHQLPRAAGVVAAIQAVGGRLRVHRGVYRAWAGAAHRKADAADLASRQTVGELGPRFGAVDGLPDGAFRTTGQKSILATFTLQRRGVKHIGVGGIHYEFRKSRLCGDRLGVRPGLAAIDRLEETAVATRRPERSHGGDVHDVGITRIDHDTPDVLRFRQHRSGPRLSAIGGLENAHAPGRAAHIVRFAAANPDHIPIARGSRHGTDRADTDRVGNGSPRDTAVGGLPDATGGDRDVHGHAESSAAECARRFDHGDVGDAPAHGGGADAAERERANEE